MLSARCSRCRGKGTQDHLGAFSSLGKEGLEGGPGSCSSNGLGSPWRQRGDQLWDRAGSSISQINTTCGGSS